MGKELVPEPKGLKKTLGDLFKNKLEELRSFRLRITLKRRYAAFKRNPSMENFCDLVEKLVENNRHEEAAALAEAMMEIGIQERKRLAR